MKKICAVILAAGSSKRLGTSKLTLKIDGRFVIQMAVEPFLHEGIERVYIVTNPENNYIKEVLEKRFPSCFEPSTVGSAAFTIVINPNFKKGMSSSIITALPYIEDCDAAFFHLGDKPFLKGEILRQMLESYEASKDSQYNIIVPVYQGRKGHPVLLDIKPYVWEMKRLKGDKGLREIIEKHSKSVLFIKGDEGTTFDIDTEDEINILKERGYTIEKG